ncbi:hypothetical protein PPN31114_00223 [Pandoraea pneumonica]|uniref:Uncharacterized protein n=1 Tax=Pandoraea pneumonica TaxID=2508299 RepID=A0A5E4RJG8_9BURK|nr:hypothetical protein PPN31114_00223 [Pandoraea pneumonica]
MTAGMSYTFGPLGFGGDFAVNEVIGVLSTFKMEDMRMVKEACFAKVRESKTLSAAESAVRRVIASLEAHLPYRLKPTDELVQFERKGI